MTIRRSQLEFRGDGSKLVIEFVESNNIVVNLTRDQLAAVSVWIAEAKVNEPKTFGKWMFGYSSFANGMIPPDKFNKSNLLNTDQYQIKYNPEDLTMTLIIGSGLANYTGTVVFN